MFLKKRLASEERIHFSYFGSLFYLFLLLVLWFVRRFFALQLVTFCLWCSADCMLQSVDNAKMTKRMKLCLERSGSTIYISNLSFSKNQLTRFQTELLDGLHWILWWRTSSMHRISTWYSNNKILDRYVLDSPFTYAEFFHGTLDLSN